jgi:hypothetical protein
MTPNLRLDQHKRFKTTLGKKLFDVRQRILQAGMRPMSVSQIHREVAKRRGTLEA